MTYDIKVNGWAPGGDPQPIGGGRVELTLLLSQGIDDVWAGMFRRQPAGVSATHTNVSYKLNIDRLTITCPNSIMNSVVEGAKALVKGINQPATERAQWQDAERRKVAEWDTAAQRKLSEDVQKIRFD